MPLRLSVRIALVAMLPTVGLLLGIGAGAVLAEAIAPSANTVDQLPTLATGGTVGLITGMAILIGLFLSGKVERGSVSSEWKAIAQESVKTTSALVPSVEKLSSVTDRLLSAFEEMNTESRLRREIEQEGKSSRPPRREGT
jgi:hypothetical protein